MTQKIRTAQARAGVIGVLVGGIGGSMTNAYFRRSNNIPSVSEVQQGCIAPGRLEITCKDQDGNGKPETIVTISKGHIAPGLKTDYLLREVDGEPVLSQYEVRPSEIIYK